MERLRSQFHPVVAYGDSGTTRRRSGWQSMAPAFSARARSRGGRRGSAIVTERADLREQLVAAGERRAW